ncbi:DUF3304 domain-containing protein ['Massilia aquatica' Lu et al. 2020]|uniref:DUF3304 domain-containing protein n=1 Tax=Pseudoduganella aquatica TaxID=2660641 RepID=A0A7X4HJ72_9BURK|nr:DUF3304 domain-containing protein [Pseudoduganella aquatica]
MTALLSAAGYISLSQRANAADHSAVGVTGVQHAGLNTSISAFYVDGMYFGKVPRQGGGGSVFCCIGLPKIWRPGLTVDIRWSETDWTNEVVAETDVGNVQSLRSVVYKAIVPVEKYDAIGPVYVHFFDHGRVRFISSLYWPEGPEHPILMVDSTAGKSAIAGTVVPDYFTPAELTEAAAKENIRKKNEVDWR